MKQTMSSTSPADIEHETEVEKEASFKMAHAKKKWIIDYQ